MANQERPTVTTRGQRCFNSTQKKATAFEWSFQGDMLKIILTPELPESQQTEKRRYDYENSWITCISRTKCIDLWKACMEEILPSIKEGKTGIFRSISVAEVNQFGIGVEPHEKYGYAPFVKLIKNINPENLTSNEEIVYVFRKGELINDYDNATGKFGEKIDTDGEFELFVSDLHAFVMASSKAYVHGSRVVDKTYKDMISTDIRAIGKKVGAEMTSFGNNGGAHYGQTSSLFDNNAPSAPADSINSLDDLDLPFN